MTNPSDPLATAKLRLWRNSEATILAAIKRADDHEKRVLDTPSPALEAEREIITDEDRRKAGPSPRGELGLRT